MKETKCPYFKELNRTCSNKGCDSARNSKGSCMCIYSNPLKCPLYYKWFIKAKKSKIEHLKAEIEVLEN